MQKCFNKIQKEQANEFYKAAGSQPGHRVNQSHPQISHGAGNEHLAVLGEGKSSGQLERAQCSRNSSALNVRCST